MSKMDKLMTGALAVTGLAMMIAWGVNRDEANRPHHPLDYYMGEPLVWDMPKSETEPETEAETIACYEAGAYVPEFVKRMEDETETEPAPTETTQETTAEPTTDEITTEAETVVQTTEAPTTASCEFSQDEILLIKVASCEAGYTGDVLLMAYIMMTVKNRVADPGHPGTVWEVLNVPEQYECIHSDLWESGYIAPGAIEALWMIYRGEVNDMGATFYCTTARNSWHRARLTYLYTHSNAEFYK